MPEKFGSPDKPLKIKCTSVGSPALDRHYWCIVTESGDQYYFGIGSFEQGMLLSAQSGKAASDMAKAAGETITA